MTSRWLDVRKMEGAGNDYVFVNAIRTGFSEGDGPEAARRLAHRHFGVGGDGLIVLAPDDEHPCRMWMWNADGSRGAMCGNGLRCLAVMAFDEGVVEDSSFVIATDAGPRAVELVFDGSTPTGARVDMGSVEIHDRDEQLEAAGRSWTFRRGDAGNPHAVVFVDEDPEEVALETVGRTFQADPSFEDGVNVEIVRVRDGGLDQRTWERGSGETLACGTGATAAALAALATGRVQGPVVPVRLRGGELRIERRGTSLVMEGAARTVFRGEAWLDLPGVE